MEKDKKASTQVVFYTRKHIYEELMREESDCVGESRPETAEGSRRHHGHTRPAAYPAHALTPPKVTFNLDRKSPGSLHGTFQIEGKKCIWNVKCERTAYMSPASGVWRGDNYQNQ